MKETLIEYKNKDCPDIYNLYIIKGNFNIPQTNKYLFEQETNYEYKLEISHKDINCISNLGLLLTLPEIKGKGKVAYINNFALGLINSFTINVDNIQIDKLTGQTLLRNYKLLTNENEKNIFDKKMLNTIDQLKYRHGNGSDYIIYKEQDIYIPLKLIYDRLIPYTTLKIRPEAKIKFELKLNKISNVLNYNNIFKQFSLDKIQELYSPILEITEYNNSQKEIKPLYYTTYEEKIYPYKKKSILTPGFGDITNIEIYVKPKNNSTYISYPDIINNELDYIQAYEKSILLDIIQVVKNKEDIKGFDNRSIFKEVIDYKIKLNNGKTCTVEILNIPEGYKIYYHTNILTFSRRDSDKVFNISNKFKKIYGTFYQSSNKIEFNKVISSLDIMDVSIPNDLWSVDINTSTGDLRSIYHKERLEINVNNPFLEGLDLVSKNTGIEELSIDAGYNTFTKNIQTCNTSDYCLNSNELYPSRHILSFNNNNILYIQPSTLKTNPSSNFFNCIIHPKYLDLDENSIFNLIQYNIHVGVTHLKELKY